MSLVSVLIKMCHVEYSRHPKAGLSGFRMAISRTFFVSGIQMAFETRSGFFSASLDRFGVNKIFFNDTFLYKTVQASTIRNPDTKVRVSNGKNNMADLA